MVKLRRRSCMLGSMCGFIIAFRPLFVYCRPDYFLALVEIDWISRTRDYNDMLNVSLSHGKTRWSFLVVCQVFCVIVWLWQYHSLYWPFFVVSCDFGYFCRTYLLCCTFVFSLTISQRYIWRAALSGDVVTDKCIISHTLRCFIIGVSSTCHIFVFIESHLLSRAALIENIVPDSSGINLSARLRCTCVYLCIRVEWQSGLFESIVCGIKSWIWRWLCCDYVLNHTLRRETRPVLFPPRPSGLKVQSIPFPIHLHGFAPIIHALV